jgi:DNA-binding response OmpR family regulator
MRILIIEDEAEIRLALESHLKAASYAVDSTDCGERGSYLARANDYDLIVLDYMLPKRDGYRVCRDIREAQKKTPILMLSVKNMIDDKVDLLNAGADDYLTKPFSFDEFSARVKALLRRPREIRNATIIAADITIDADRQSVLRGDKNIYLTRKEFALLEYLAQNKGRVVSRGQIMEHVWDMGSDPFSNTIEAHILNLRKKLGVRKQKLIHTVPGRGYRFDTSS